MKIRDLLRKSLEFLVRGIRAGKSAQRKRKAYIKYRLETEPDLTLDQIYLVHADKTQRPLYSRAPGWTPDLLDQDDDEYVIIVVEEEEAASASASGAPKPSSSASASGVPKPSVAASSSGVPKPSVAVSPSVAPEPTIAATSSPSSSPSSAVIPKATSGVPKFGRLFTPPPPPAPRLRPTAKARPVAKEVVPKPPPVPKAAKSKPPVQAKARLIAREPDDSPPAAPVAAPVEKGFIDSNILGGGTLLISPVSNRRVKLRDSIRGSVTRIALLDFHNTIDRYFVPGRRQPFSMRFVIAAEDNQGGRTCIVLCSHINNSQANESWLRDCITNSCEDTGEVSTTERCLFDLVIVTRPSAEFLILDDQAEVISEFIRAGQQGFQVLLPKRERCQLGRAYANVFEAEDAVLAWISRPF